MKMANVILPTTASFPGWFKKAVIPFWPLMLRTAGFVKRAANMLDTRKDIKELHAEVLRGSEERIGKTGFWVEQRSYHSQTSPRSLRLRFAAPTSSKGH